MRKINVIKVMSVFVTLCNFGVLAQSNYFDITQYGASTGAADNRIAIQRALDAAKVLGGTVFVPSGTFKVNGVLKIYADVTITGVDKTSSILVQVGQFGEQNGHPDNSKGLLYAEAPRDGELRNISIKNMALKEQVTSGEKRFIHEFQHLISLNGVRDAVIQDLYLEGARGDAIYIGSGVEGDNKNIHNNNVLIKDNVIDGVDSDNRNGISVVHGNKITIERNVIRNTSRHDMPGAIDIEPDRPHHHVQDIYILDNVINGGKAGAGLISIYIGDGNKNTSGKFVVARNKIDGKNSAEAGIFLDVFPKVNRGNYIFDIAYNEIKNTNRGVMFLGLDNLHFNGNTIENTTDDPLIGEAQLVRSKVEGNVNVQYSSLPSKNLNFAFNIFKEVGTARGNGFQVYNVQWMYWGDNDFYDFGLKDKSLGYVFDFANGKSDNVTFVNNEIYNNLGRTHYIIQKESNHLFDAATNKYCNNYVVSATQLYNSFQYNSALCN